MVSCVKWSSLKWIILIVIGATEDGKVAKVLGSYLEGHLLNDPPQGKLSIG